MTTRFIASLLVASGLLTAPAAAQDNPEPQTGPTASTSKQTAAVATGPRSDKDKIERLLDFIEDNPVLRLLNAQDGLGLRFGGIDSGAGFAVGPSWRASNVLDGLVKVRASAAMSIAGDRGLEAGIGLPEVGSHRVALGIGVSADHLARERFFGLGPSSLAEGQTVFTLDRRAAAVNATLAATRWLRLSGSAGLAMLDTADGTARGLSGISTRWTSDDAPGLETATSFTTMSFSATADRRDVPGNPRRGGRYTVRLERYLDRSLDRHSFSRARLDVEQHLSWWRGQRLLTLRASTVLSNADRGHDVPFFLQPTLGGSQGLRGFVTDRFRDRNLFFAQAEYAWDVWPFLNAVLFYETGQVASHWQQLTLKNFERDYGIGFRLGSARTIALRTDVALGSGEGTRITMRFSHAF